MSMKKNSSLVIVVSLFIGICMLSGCEKLSDAEKQEIERYQKSPRDPQLIGQWEFRTKKTKRTFLFIQ